MICPACRSRLKNVKFEAESVDICLSCGGMWLDKDELGRVASSLLIGDKVDYLTVKEVYREKVVSCYNEEQSLRRCPKCNTDMNAFNYAFDSNIILDKCPSCGGVWTDRNEIIEVARHIKGNPITRLHGQALMEAIGARNKKERSAALGISSLYLGMAFRFGEEGDWWRILMFLVLPLTSILFSGIGGYSETSESFGLFSGKKDFRYSLRWGGWVLLSLPLIWTIFSFFIT